MSLVERHGSVRSFRVGAVDKTAINKILADHIAAEARIHTDESRLYVDVADTFATHETVNHRAKEYARDDVNVHVNSAEGYFACSSGALTASISITGRSIYTGIWQNMTFGTIIAFGSASTT